ncbi:metallophosphoesterase [Myxococcaceae bacterium JPH2]|nr:metallophosphoesterase [Myxococcaceae bacterium JPH2]
MRILSLETTPFLEWRYLNAAPRGGTRVERLPLLRGWVDALPPGVEAVLATSDLQGMATSAHHDGAATLLGEFLADEVAMQGAAGELPLASNTGVLLAGDLYSNDLADKRGASGDVRSVWNAFTESFRWVAGVAGNHDMFGEPGGFERFRHKSRAHVLDGDLAELDGLRVGGVSYIIGRPDKTNRREQSAQLERIESVLLQEPQVLVLHEGPDAPEQSLPGNAFIREAVAPWNDLLIICGHSHWDVPLVPLPGGVQVLNVDARAVLLQPIASKST